MCGQTFRNANCTFQCRTTGRFNVWEAREPKGNIVFLETMAFNHQLDIILVRTCAFFGRDGAGGALEGMGFSEYVS